MSQSKSWTLKPLNLALAGGVLLSSALLSSASAQLVTLEDLRKAMQNSETTNEDEPAAEPTPVEDDSEEVVVAEPEETTSSKSDVITLDDLRAALGIQPDSTEPAPAVGDAPVEQASTRPQTTPTPSAEPTTPVVTASAPPTAASVSTGNYNSPAENWVCNVSLRSVRAADSNSEDGLGEPGSKISLYFDTADYSITRDSMVALARETGKLLSLVAKGEKLAVIGYTDAAGNAQSNIILSLRRAYNTKACLIEITGLNPEDIIVQGHGSFSVVREPQEALNSANRRTDIMLYSDYMDRFETTFAALNQPN